MKQGDSIAIIRDHDTKPSESRNTRLIAAAIASGAVFSSESAFLDTLEETPNGARRTVTWLMDGNHKIEFQPITESEMIDMGEFRRRFESLDWCEKNPNHPIAYMRSMNDHYNRLLDKIKTMRPMLLIRKPGNRFAIVPSGSDAASVAERDQILAEF